MVDRIFVDGSGDGRFCWYNETDNSYKSYKQESITNNEAEYLAILKALEENHSEEIEIFSDSEVVVNQLNRNYHIKEVRLRGLFDKVQEIIKKKNIKVKFIWIPRGENKAGKYLG